MITRLGLIAGCGEFPLLFAGAAKSKGIELVCVAIKDETNLHIGKIVEKTHWISLQEVKKLIEIFRKEKIKQAVMIGGIKKTRLFNEEEKRPADPVARLILKIARDKRDLTLFKAAALVLWLNGIKLISPLFCMEEYIAKKGCLTKREPTKDQRKDIRFGYKMAKRLASLDIGQTVVVKDKMILAVESIEGTDEAIKRGGQYAKEGAVVVKVARPRQDMRFDIPVIGNNTIDALRQVRAGVLAVEKDKMLITNKSGVITQANESGISIVVI